jgi:squalene synthase HpnD
VEPSTAYRYCEHIVRTRARNFSYGIRLLPAPKRQALSAVYAFARQIDDIGDDEGPAETRLEQLARMREHLEDLDGARTDAVLVALADAARRLPIPLDAFAELIDGCEADVRGATYETFDDLVCYCRCVAGTVGRLSLGVFGTDQPDVAVPLADSLGVALQLTNILRDIHEDRLTGRVYLPKEDLAHFGCALELNGSGVFADPPDRIIALISFQAARARDWYDQGLRLLPLIDRRSASCVAAMAGIYRRLLARISADPVRAVNTRTSLPTWEKALVAGRALSQPGGRW